MRYTTLGMLSISLLGSLFGCSRVNAETASGSSEDTPRLSMELPRDADGNVMKLELEEDQWKKRLSPEAYYILRQDGTERPGTSPLLKDQGAGVYACRGCGLALFKAADKFDSGTGWPSYTRPISAGRINDVIDRKYGMVRVENRCTVCDGHLGHVFNDGPKPTGLRYCINGDALFFIPEGEIEAASRPEPAPDEDATTQPAETQPEADSSD